MTSQLPSFDGKPGYRARIGGPKGMVLVRARLRPILAHREKARLAIRCPRDEFRHEIAPLSFHERSPHQLPYLFPLPLHRFADKENPNRNPQQS
jgi:hypothetical protein